MKLVIEATALQNVMHAFGHTVLKLRGPEGLLSDSSLEGVTTPVRYRHIKQGI